MSGREDARDPSLDAQEAVRIDKWLWAARFFKTRSSAAVAVSGGKVHVDDVRVKPSRKIRAGSELQIRRGSAQWHVVVKGVSTQRRPAKEAAALYEETPESITLREQERARRKREAAERSRRLGRPSKRDRRELARLKSRPPNGA